MYLKIPNLNSYTMLRGVSMTFPGKKKGFHSSMVILLPTVSLLFLILQIRSDLFMSRDEEHPLGIILPH